VIIHALDDARVERDHVTRIRRTERQKPRFPPLGNSARALLLFLSPLASSP
jgi:hypothetical protein